MRKKRAGQQQQRQLEVRRHGVNLLSVVTNPRDPRPAFASLFDDARDAAALTAKDSASFGRRISLQDFALLTTPEMRRLYDRFVANLESREEREQESSRAATPKTTAAAEADERKHLQAVPRKFFEPAADFQLQDASNVFQSEQDEETTEREEARLAGMLDVVEGALVRQLNKSSDDFFQALSNFHELSDQVSATVAQVRRLRSRIQSMQCDAVQGVLRVPRLACRQSNLIALQAKLVAMRDVKQTCDKVHAAMLAEDYSSTVAKIAAAKRTIDKSLKDVRSLRHVAKRLDQFYELAISYMGARWVNFAVATTWTEDSAANGQSDEAVRGGSDRDNNDVGKDSSPRRTVVGDATAAIELPSFATSRPLTLTTENVTPLIEGLARSGRLPHVLTKFQQRFDEEAREILNTVVLEYANNQAQQASSSAGAAASATDSSAAAHNEDVASEQNGTKSPDNNGELSAATLNALTAPAFQSCFETCLDHLFSSILAAIALHNFLYDYLDAALAHAPSDEDGDDRNGVESASNTTPATVADQEEDDDAGIFEESRRRASAVIRTNAQQTLKTRIENDESPRRSVSSGSGMLTKRVIRSLMSQSERTARAVCETAMKKMARLVSLREDGMSKSKLSDLTKLWRSAQEFASVVDDLTGGIDEAGAEDNSSAVSAALRRALLVQAKSFLERHHALHKNELMTTLDSEKWQQVDVTPERQLALDRLATGYVSSKKSVAHQPNGASATVQQSGTSRTGSQSTKAKRELRGAVIDGKSFKLVWSAVRLLEIVDAKLAVAACLPVLSFEVVSRVVDLLRFFESRTRQLVLFAGAIHSSARLKTITARHLGLASQCLSIVVTLAPHIRASVADAFNGVSQRPDLTELDAVTNDYLDHRNRILSKFVGIISESLDASARSLPRTNWDDSRNQNQARDGSDVFHSPFVVEVIKNIVNMHGVLAKLLPPEQLQEVFTNIYDILATKIPQFFGAHVNPEMPHGRTRVVEDLRYLVQNVSKLQVQSTNLKRIESFAQERYGGTRRPA